MKTQDNSQNLFNTMAPKSTSLIKVIGVGGGGGNAVAHMYNLGIVGVDFAICNTDNQALDSNPVPIKIQLGPDLTDGKGAGSIPEVGKEACIESIEEVRRFLDTSTRMLFITAGMGGGTGTGAAPIIAKAAKEMGILTIGIVTKPFSFEGNKRMKYALEGIERMRQNVDSLLIINNDRLREMFGDSTMKEAFGKADDILAIGAKGIAEIITVAGYVNVDFADVNTVMRNSGVAMMGTGQAEGEDRAIRAVEMALNSPLLQDKEIQGAKYILFNITSGKKDVTMDEISTITNYITEEAGYGTDIIWGNCSNEALGDRLAITIIATGFHEVQVEGKKKIEETIYVPLEDKDDTPSLRNITETSNVKEVIEIELDVDDVKDTIRTMGKPSRVNLDDEKPSRVQIVQRPALSNDRKLELEKAKKEYLRKTHTVPLDNANVVAQIEQVPAYKRREVQLDRLDPEHMEKRTHGTRIIVDENGDLSQSENSFLFGNVD